MTIQEAKQEMLAAIVESTETEVPVTEETHLVQGLGLSSMEVVVLLSDLEEKFGITIPVRRVRHVQTVGDLWKVILNILQE